MKSRPMLLAALLVAGISLTSCLSTPREATWREATALVLGEGSAQAQTMEGEALKTYLQTFVLDERPGFRLVHDTRTGYLIVGGKRYLVTVAKEKTADGHELLTIHAGANPLHLMQR